VDPQASESVVHVDREKTWTDAVFASLRPTGHHVSDDEIFEILNGGSDQETAADLCAAKGVTVPMYCVWRAKYRHLNLDELRKVRRRELWRARALLGVLLAATVLGAGGIGFGLARVAYVKITAAAEPQRPVTLAAEPTPPIHVQIAPAVPDSPQVVSTAPEATPMEPATLSDSLPPTAEPGYSVQVAAADSLQQGRVLVERLAVAGYPAYLSRAFVGDIEVFRVRVGPFDARPAAEEIASQLRRDGYQGAWIAR
jgi:cell division septation protein DedD